MRPPLAALRASSLALLISVLHGAGPAAVPLVPGGLAKLKRSETLMFQGKDIYSAPKEEEFTVLKHDSLKHLVYVEFYKDDGTLVAVTAPADAFEPSAPDAWDDLRQGVEAFRDQRYEEARRLLARAAAADSPYKALATPLSTRISGAIVSGSAVRSAPAARAGFINVLQGLRDSAEQLQKLGHFCLALPMDEGTDRLAAWALNGAPGAPASKLNRDELTKRVSTSKTALGRTRQAVALHKLYEASKYIEEGLGAEPERPELKSIQERVQKDIAEANGHSKNARSMLQHGPKGTVHALTAVEMGLKLCVDHPKLRELKKEMQGAFEERTAPPVNAAFLAAAGSGANKDALTEGHKIYTTRCTECHDLELLDSRSMTAWQTIVGGMSRRAKISEEQQARIVEYIAAAQRGLDRNGAQ